MLLVKLPSSQQLFIDWASKVTCEFSTAWGIGVPNPYDIIINDIISTVSRAVRFEGGFCLIWFSHFRLLWVLIWCSIRRHIMLLIWIFVCVSNENKPLPIEFSTWWKFPFSLGRELSLDTGRMNILCSFPRGLERDDIGWGCSPSKCWSWNHNPAFSNIFCYLGLLEKSICLHWSCLVAPGKSLGKAPAVIS